MLKQIHHNYGVFYFLTHPKYFLRFFLLSTSPTAPCSQSNFHQRSSLKTVHRTVFFTLAFESLLSLCLYNKKEHQKVFFFMVRQQYSCFILNFYLVLCGLLLVIISSTLSLKTVHRTVFFTLALESLLSLCLYNKKRTPKGVLFMVRQQGLEPRTDRL